MSYGFLATNDNNQVLVSSDTRNLHFIGKAILNQVRNTFDTYGGCRIFAFVISSPVPVVPFFTMPTNDFYGIVAIRGAGESTWEIEVLRSGTSAVAPECYVFADARAVNSTETFGMKVFHFDGSAAFDSRLRPLTVAGGASVYHPSNPKPALPYGMDPRYCGTDATTSGAAFAPDQVNSFGVSITPTKPIYSFASIAQAEREATYSASEEECDGFDAYGNCVGAKRIYVWSSTYWAFYRGGIRRTGNVIDAGWVTVAYGCRWTYSVAGSFIGIGTGTNSGTGGTWPYSNETLNLAPSAVIIADGARYD